MERFEKGTGIICEYNPFHKGHAYQIEVLKKMGAKFVVCAMSGDFTQRGEAAFQDKRIRAENAVRNGADIILEIPFPFSSLSAEGFARSGMGILEASGLCSSFAFGSECGDTDRLQRIADTLDGEFHEQTILLQKSQNNLSYATARERLICERLSKEDADIIKKPNDILGTEYLKFNRSLCPIAIKRETPRGGFDSRFASSSYIRKVLCEQEKGVSVKEYLPDNYCFDGIFYNDGAFYNHILLSLMQKDSDELAGIAEVSGGCEYSIISNAVKAESFEELCELMASKTLTDAKIRRMLMFSFFGVTKDAARSVPVYTQVLAASEKGHKMLKKHKAERRITIASRISQIKRDKDAKKQYDFARMAAEVLGKCRKIIR